jgi:hypothetical protein
MEKSTPEQLKSWNPIPKYNGLGAMAQRQCYFEALHRQADEDRRQLALRKAREKGKKSKAPKLHSTLRQEKKKLLL